jgi:hypothetical protein
MITGGDLAWRGQTHRTFKRISGCLLLGRLGTKDGYSPLGKVRHHRRDYGREIVELVAVAQQKDPSVSKSENLKKVRQRTDQMIKRQATRKERQENEAQQAN